MRARIVAVSVVVVLVAAVLFLRRGDDTASPQEHARGAAADGGARAGDRAQGEGARREGDLPGRSLAGDPLRRSAPPAPGAGRDAGAASAGDGDRQALLVPGVPAKKAGGASNGAHGRGTIDAADAGIAAAGGAGGIRHVARDLEGGSGEPGDGAGASADGTAGDAAGEDAQPAAPEMLFSSTEDKQYDTTDPIDIPDSQDFPRDVGSVNFWLEPGWEGNNQDDADFIDLGDGGLRVVKNVNYLRFEFLDANGVEGGVGVDISGWKIGEARQVTATWDGANVSLYVDGKLVSQRPHGGFQRQDERGPVVIGSVYPPDRPIAPGVLTGVQVFGHPLGPWEVGSLYDTGKKKK